MTAADVLTRADLRELWPVLFGHELRRERGRAAWRDGSGHNVKVTERSATDYVTGNSYDILGVVVLAHGGSRKDALEWLAAYCGVTLGKTSSAKARRMAARHDLARERAADLIVWRDKLILALRAVRNSAWGGANQTDLETDSADRDDPATWDAINEVVNRRRIGDSIEDYLADVAAMGAADLSGLQAQLERRTAPC